MLAMAATRRGPIFFLYCYSTSQQVAHHGPSIPLFPRQRLQLQALISTSRPRSSRLPQLLTPSVAQAQTFSSSTSSAAVPLSNSSPSVNPTDDNSKTLSSQKVKEEEEEEQVRNTETFRVSSSQAGQRIDKLLADHFNQRSRTYIQSLLSQSLVLLDNIPVSSKSTRPLADQLITITFMRTLRDTPLSPEPIPLSILYEDEHLAVIDKPAGLVVHPSPGHWTGTLVHALLHRYPSLREEDGERPGIVHRLDKGTSGVIIIARTREAHARLSEMFAERRVSKEYLALTVGNPCGNGRNTAHIDVPMGRCRKDRTRMVVDLEDGKEARTTFNLIGSDDKRLVHAVRVQLHTGRTHQIRVHTRHVRAPILGDDLYGAPDVNKRFATAAQRPMLHAWAVKFEHPINKGEVVSVRAPLPDDIERLLIRVLDINLNGKSAEEKEEETGIGTT